MYYRLPNIIAINIADKIQSLHCHHHVRSVPDVFSGEILLVFPVVHFQTSYRKTLGMIFIMKEILILLRQNHACLLKVGEMKQSETVGVISKLESLKTGGKSIKIFRIQQVAHYVQIKEYSDIQCVIFKYLIFFFGYQIL